ncbi:DUF3530 family protein [Eionea flava]
MGKKHHLATIFVICLGLLANTGWAQNTEPTTNTAENEETENTDKQQTPETNTPSRLSSKITRSTITADRKRKMQLLADQLPSGQPYWLNDGTSEFLGIWQEDRSGDAQGALLILHAEGEHPAWPQTTQPLHDSLPEYGWATMAIQLPDPLSKPLPKRTLAAKSIAQPTNRDIVNEGDESEGANDENSSDESTTSQANPEKETAKNMQPTENNNPSPQATQDVEDIAEKRLTVAIKFLHDKGQFNIVLMGSGTSAIRGHKLMKEIVPVIDDARLKKKIEKPIRGSILFNAKNTLPTSSEVYKDWFFDPEIPILDIYTATNLQNQQDAKMRKVLSKKNKAIAYKQLKVSELSYEKSWKENRLSRRIRSFLDAYIQGIEVTNAKLKKQ